ncbi:hypothetical protein ACFPES_28305 [Paenibacillus sp. GCM10023248]|uniref:hypothetical protein n=1 Tax=Bacillales TaxID=1385 RepID=UPI0023799B7C|nr:MULTISPECIES: hypothetical protein [Bacillales]MDD9270957.1 hypothetical protein [Paenibacillus sp. MAHUQ-63]MDR6882908.1 hypothetical protein [Bacillus sp. 3255]
MFSYPAYYGYSQPIRLHDPAYSPYYQPYYSTHRLGDNFHFTNDCHLWEQYDSIGAGYKVWEPRDYPKVDTKMLSHSLAASQSLLKDASLVTHKLQDPEIARSLMANAQQGNQKEVDRIVQSFGCSAAVVTTYSPSSVKFTMDSRSLNTPYCEITLMLKWGE